VKQPVKLSFLCLQEIKEFFVDRYGRIADVTLRAEKPEILYIG
jgi:hypothetical protein